MDKERGQEILESLEQYDKCSLECDGLTRVISYILTVNNLEHQVCIGEILDTTTGNQFSPHFWIDLPDGKCIDYRAQMWLGLQENIPHGIFDPTHYPVQYKGLPHSFSDLERVALLLLQYECHE